MKQRITKEFKITATEDVMKRFERFLGFFHYNGGHTNTFAMPFDGDGSDYLKVDPPPPKYPEKNLIAGAGHEIEIALDNSYKAVPVDHNRTYYVAKDNGLSKITPEGITIKVK